MKIQPKNKEELVSIIEETINEKGFECDLNFIDTSLITDMSYLFSYCIENKVAIDCDCEYDTGGGNYEYGVVSTIQSGYDLNNFNGDISEWDVSNVINMSGLFYKSQFDGDISKWKTSKVEHMSWMFGESEFNQDISNWNVSHVTNMNLMFCRSKFNGNISKWDVSNVEDMSLMFYESYFNNNIDKWKVYSLNQIEKMFDGCDINLPYWYKGYESNKVERVKKISIYHLNKEI
jgi:surface protein